MVTEISKENKMRPSFKGDHGYRQPGFYDKHGKKVGERGWMTWDESVYTKPLNRILGYKKRATLRDHRGG